MTTEIEQWQNFLTTVQKDILPIYRRHEKEFDYMRFHGRLHICRSIIFAEIMASLYSSFMEIDKFAIRYAVAFHDSGRQGNGIDIWESVSAENCGNYLRQTLGIDDAYSQYVSQLIVKQKTPIDINQQIANDADTLEIMRLKTKSGFKPSYWHFGKNIPELISWRETLIDEAWQLIDFTEKLNRQLVQTSYFQDTITLAKAYPLMGSILQEVEG
ncbi:MAG TPA: hypothetical protein DEG17_22125 [Cyanobacteria bacterium UBA11149]|nr:hypothetical protein [Cyanobacteria bacterium UBA11367]HBE59142.1 hypothetical protein [Cyanobacteria bacterium UBA11366]HBK63134.1 hypothetical protein [Cyanobacteria bacterium UBA11166]HBR72217.1 hypothetical protein [Cyanobacteria bacterium UBA11159]HBS68801.1 hypothetical protein [Cyanobacteria bacterium UBA11153]HBW91480.1 hypothetical protein [Cyanobacteria bacterium UBA11149]